MPAARRSERPAPEALKFEVAGFGIRFVGFVIDVVVYFFILLLSVITVGLQGVFVPLLAQWLFNSIGGSPGKWMTGLRLVNSDGDPPGAAAGLGRTLIAIPSWWLFGLGYLWAAGQMDNRTWHDLAAGTYVIYDR